MNLQPLVSEQLWTAIETNYGNRNFTAAILDAIYYLSGLIREKTGLQSDGVSLIGQAFGGSSPKLKVNRLQTESEINVQKGTQQLLTGIYQSIRNPRSHEKHTDSEGDAAAIILFINYVLGIIEQSRTPFTKSKFLERVFDPHFVGKKRYASILAAEIPPKQQLEILIDVWREKSGDSAKKIRYLVTELVTLLSNEEKDQFFELISDELKDVKTDVELRVTVQVAPKEFWPHCDEAARLRTDSRLIDSIRQGRYDPVLEKCKAGALGTWFSSLAASSPLKEDFVDVLATKLISDPQEQAYVFQYFLHVLPPMYEKPPSYIKEALLDGLKEGKQSFYDSIESVSDLAPEWKSAFEEAMSTFVSRPSDDEIPF